MSEIIPIIGAGADSNAYLFLDDKVALIDAGAGLDDRITLAVREAIGDRTVDFIFNTHAHFDHCGGDSRFEGARIHVHRDDAREMISGRFYGTYQLYAEEKPTRFHRLLEEGDKFDLGDRVLEVLHTPGHTFGSVCLLERDAGALFSGDTLFSHGGFGRIDMGGDGKHMLRSLERLSGLAFKTLYPGHGSVVEEGQKHAMLGADSAREFMRGGLGPIGREP